MDARFTPQEAVIRGLSTPADCDLTVVLVWSRLGTPLVGTRPESTPYRNRVGVRERAGRE